MMRKFGLVAVCALAFVVLDAGVAGAHVTVSPSSLPQGTDDAILTFRVPNESATAAVTGLKIQFPLDPPDRPGEPRSRVGLAGQRGQVRVAQARSRPTTARSRRPRARSTGPAAPFPSASSVSSMCWPRAFRRGRRSSSSRRSRPTATAPWCRGSRSRQGGARPRAPGADHHLDAGGTGPPRRRPPRRCGDDDGGLVGHERLGDCGADPGRLRRAAQLAGGLVGSASIRLARAGDLEWCRQIGAGGPEAEVGHGDRTRRPGQRQGGAERRVEEPEARSVGEDRFLAWAITLRVGAQQRLEDRSGQGPSGPSQQRRQWSSRAG